MPHNARHIELARRLRVKHGWTYKAIADRIGVSHTTVIYWLDPEYRERQSLAKRIYWQERTRKNRAAVPMERVWARAMVLRKAGMSYGGIRIVLEVDYGVSRTPEAISHRLRAMGCPPDLRRGRPFGHSQDRPQGVAA